MRRSTGNNPATPRPRSRFVDRIYLVPPSWRVTYSRLLSGFLDLAEACGLRHVTYLRRPRQRPSPRPKVDSRAANRPHEPQPSTSSVLRPHGLQNFTPTNTCRSLQGLITVPTAGARCVRPTRRRRHRRGPPSSAADPRRPPARVLAHRPEALTVGQVCRHIARSPDRPSPTTTSSAVACDRWRHRSRAVAPRYASCSTG